MPFSLTPSQETAVKYRGGSLLVSAAAGSGKTRVLVERLLSYISEGRDIDSFLIITYTRAAAAELKSRILTELNQRVALSPDDRRLRRQATLCYRAQIGTIHSFCTTVLRENAHLAGLTPDFSVLEEDRAEAIKARVLEKLLDRRYEKIEGDAAFRALADTVGAGRDDSRLSSVTLELHTKLMSHAWPEVWASEQKAAMALEKITDAGETVWGRELLDSAQADLLYWRNEIQALLSELSSAEGAEAIQKAYGPALCDDLDMLIELASCLAQGWDRTMQRLPIVFTRLGGLRNSPDEELSNRIKARRDALRKAMQSLEKQFSAPSEQLLADMRVMGPAMEALLELCLDFDRAYTAEKRRQGALDFSDLEHLTLSLLYDRGASERTALAEALSGRYTEIMVDEYQDVNAVQDLIFTSVSKHGNNLFMVGDVKQSIYRFRLADPNIFLRRYAVSVDADTAAAADGRTARVLLRENFRSRAGVLQAANHVFRNIMSRALGELDYDSDAALVPGAEFPGADTPVCMYLLAAPADSQDEESPDKTEAEAAFTAAKIRALVESRALITEDGAQRPVGYGDIVILLRSPGGSGEKFRRALVEAGVPAEAQQGGSFFAFPEVAAVVSMLAVIDNPRQDVPLISVLRSPVFGFTADELAEIRVCDKKHDFYTALLASAEKMQKSRDFLALLDSLRSVAPDMPVDELLRLIIDKTGMTAAVSAMPDGVQRRENLMLLLEYAGRFEENGYRGLFRFNQWMRRLMDRGDSPAVSRGLAGCVRIMSIHKSKGLEFPVVFLCDTERRFNKQDAMSAVLVHSELGLGPKYTDIQKAAEWPTLSRRAIAKRMITETLSEEMRVYYVAMTRAKERLYITCCLRDPEDAVQKLRDGLRSPLPPQLLVSAQSPARWLIRAALLEDSPIQLKISESSEAGESETADEAENSGELRQTPPADDADYERLKAAAAFEYKYAWAVSLPSKLTATGLKDETGAFSPADEAAALVEAPPEPQREFRRPQLGIAKQLTAAQKGTATHVFLQYADFFRASSGAQAVHEEISRLVSRGSLSPEEGEAVNIKSVLGFFDSDIGRRVLACRSPLREFRFSLLRDAAEFFPVPEGEKLLLQGVVDCAIEEDGLLTVIDYKTDSVKTPAEIQARAQHYAPQLEAYATALEAVTGKRVRETVLYFLRPGKAVCKKR